MTPSKPPDVLHRLRRNILSATHPWQETGALKPVEHLPTPTCPATSPPPTSRDSSPKVPSNPRRSPSHAPVPRVVTHRSPLCPGSPRQAHRTAKVIVTAPLLPGRQHPRHRPTTTRLRLEDRYWGRWCTDSDKLIIYVSCIEHYEYIPDSHFYPCR
ncbi:hypothetical protein C8J57DRAFT_1379882 [Mycena rebaudengoi]|nr:hypothetical protein C8J57DRAFT_1379882 [Mycena rebaudengoi]